MKYLKRYNESLDSEPIITKIREEFPEDRVEKMLQDEILEWVDDEESYKENGNGEAEETVIYRIVGWYETTHNVKLDIDQNQPLIDEIKKAYPILKDAF